MIPAQRSDKILEILKDNKIISYMELSELLGVSHMTIRRDVNKLEELGKVVPVAGGVQLVSHLTSEPSHDDKLSLSHDEKEQIADLALEYVNAEVNSIYLDAGTTCLEIAKKLATLSDKLFITNDFKVADCLVMHSDSDIIFIGGELHKTNHSTVGQIAADVLATLNIDLAFISTSSWNKKGLSTPDSRKVVVKKAAIVASMRKILVTDSSKYGQRAPYHIVGLNAFDAIITDSHFSQMASETLRDSQNIVIIKADAVTSQCATR